MHIHHICNPTPHAHIPILSHNVTHRTLQAADPVTTAFAIAHGQVVELPRMQRHTKERTHGTHMAQARCTAGRRRNYRVFACVNAPICVPTLLSLPVQGPFAHAKGCFCMRTRSKNNRRAKRAICARKRVYLRPRCKVCGHAKGAFCIRKNGVKGAFAMPWHRVGQRYACYTCTRNARGSNPTHSKIETYV